jgi:hypothetical protein
MEDTTSGTEVARRDLQPCNNRFDSHGGGVAADNNNNNNNNNFDNFDYEVDVVLEGWLVEGSQPFLSSGTPVGDEWGMEDTANGTEIMRRDLQPSNDRFDSHGRGAAADNNNNDLDYLDDEVDAALGGLLAEGS